MSRRRNIKVDEDRTDINISPMIDMVFILLIFFIVTTVFVEERGIEAEKPLPGARSDDKTEPVKIRVTSTGQILLNGDEIGLATIRTHVADHLREKSDLPVIVEVEEGVTAGRMEQVIDQARLGNAEKVSVTQAVKQN